MLSNYSYSSLATYQTCPRKFKFAYLEKVEIPVRITADTYMGNAVHRTLDRLYATSLGETVASLEEMVRFYQDEWDKPDRKYITVVNEYQTVDDYIQDGQKMLERYYQKYKPFKQGKTIGTEMNIQFELENTPFRIKAKIDRLWKRDDEVIEICDYKTGHLPQEGIKDKSFYHQMGLYQMAVQTKFPHWQEIELAQYYLKYDEIIRRCLRSDELDELKEEVRTTIVETINAEKLDNFPTKESGLCNYCEFFKFCPAKRHKMILDEEEGVDSKERTSIETASEQADRYLKVHRQIADLETEEKALKEDLVRLAKELRLNKFNGTKGEVMVKVGPVEKFVTKSLDPKAFAELTHLVREIGLEGYFKLDERALMKEVYQKERLSPDFLEALRKYVVTKEEARITTRYKGDSEENE